VEIFNVELFAGRTPEFLHGRILEYLVDPFKEYLHQYWSNLGTKSVTGLTSSTTSK